MTSTDVIPRSARSGTRSDTAQIVARIARKVGSAALTMWLVTLLVFFSRFLVPGDPVRFLLRGRRPNPDAVAAITAQYGLDLPPWQQYVNWMSGMFHGDFGRSLQYRQPVAAVIGQRLPMTLTLVAMAAVLILIIGVLLGMYSAIHRNGPGDAVTITVLTVLSAIPSFVGSIILIAIFAVNLAWFPSFGGGQGFVDTLYHLTLPAIALTIVYLVVVAKVTRSAMVEQFNSEHVEVALSRGLRPRLVMWRHVFRNSLRPIIAVCGPMVAGLLVATTIVESTFGISGVGNLLVDSVSRLDFPVVQAIVLLVAAAFVLVNTIIDLVEPIIDP